MLEQNETDELKEIAQFQQAFNSLCDDLKEKKAGRGRRFYTGIEVIVRALVAMARDKETPDKVRLDAINSILDRYYGRPQQAMDIKNKIDGVILEFLGEKGAGGNEVVKNEVDEKTIDTGEPLE